MNEFELYKELMEITMLIKQSKITPEKIKQTFDCDYGTRVDISWLNNTINGVPVESEPIIAKDIGIIHSMRLSANEIVNNIGSAVQADLMFPAIMFCYMHYLELALKVIAKRNDSYYEQLDPGKKINLHIPRNRGHDLSYLWTQVKGAINNQLKLNNNEGFCLDEIVANLTKLCNTSMGYRYAEDLGGHEYFDNSNFHVDLKIVYIWVNVLDEYLCPLYDGDWQIE